MAAKKKVVKKAVKAKGMKGGKDMKGKC